LYLDIVRVLYLNPTSVEFEFAGDALRGAVQKPDPDGGSEEEIELPIAQLIHRKWNAPQFSGRGNSMVTPAFESIELLRDYQRAQRAIAKCCEVKQTKANQIGKKPMRIKLTIQGISPLLMNRFTKENEVQVSSGLSVAFQSGSKLAPREQAARKTYSDKDGRLYLPGPNIM